MGPLEDMARFAATREGPQATFGDSAYSSDDWGRRMSQVGVQPMLLKSTTEPFGHLGHSDHERDRRRARRLSVMQDFIEGRGEHKCKKCGQLEEKYVNDRKRFHLEMEHLRRGVQKLLDTCEPLMSASAFHVLKDSLQLGVRYFTEHTEGERDLSPIHESPTSQKSVPTAGGGLERELEKLEEELRKLERENAQLLKELKKYESGFRAGSRGPPPRLSHTEMQTDPVFIGDPGRRRSGPDGRPGSASDSDSSTEGGHRRGGGGPGGSSRRRSRHAKGAEAASHEVRTRAAGSLEDSDEEGGGRGRGRGGGGSGGGGGPGSKGRSGKAEDDSQPRKPGARKKSTGDSLDNSKELALLRLELDQARAKLREAQVKLAEQAAAMPGSVVVQQSPKVIIQDRTQVVTVTEGGGAPGDAGSKDSSSGRNTSATYSGPGDRQGSRTRSGHGGKVGDQAGQKQGGVRRAPDGSILAADGEEGSNSERLGPDGRKAPAIDPDVLAAAIAAAKPETADQCVGNGPGPGLQDEPVRARGRALVKEQELNKTGICFSRSLRSEPTLEGTLSSNGIASASPSVTLPSTALSATLPSATTSATLPSVNGDAEPKAARTLPSRPTKEKAGRSVGAAASLETTWPGPVKKSATFSLQPSLDLVKTQEFGTSSSSQLRLGRQRTGMLDLGTAPRKGFTRSATDIGSVMSSTGGLGPGALREAEPYLVQLWDQQPLGHRQHSQTELMRLGALTPAPPVGQPVAVSRVDSTATILPE
mmetsp:Transcript_138350/g.385900  ORF Transcript_138350/g.385900 Transcript_138350/m.385900 type:complete len:759 (+) Transcript_138350:175-2451(+)